MDDSKKRQIGEEIRRQRVLRNLTQDELGDALGYSKQTISAWENGRLAPTEETFENLSSLFNFNPGLMHKDYTEEKEMQFNVKKLEELDTVEEIERSIDQILNILPLQGDNSFVIKYILKRLIFVGVSEALCKNRICKMHNHKFIEPFSWFAAIDDVLGLALYLNFDKSPVDMEDSCTTVKELRKELISKQDLFFYGYYGKKVNLLDCNADELEENAPLKGNDRKIVKRGYDSVFELLEVLPFNDNSLITSILVYSSIIRDITHKEEFEENEQ